MKTLYTLLIASAAFTITSCKKEGCTEPLATNFNEEAKKDDGSCIYDEGYVIPTTFSFTNGNGNNTVDYSGQTERLDQLSEMVTLMKSGTTQAISAQALKDMFANTGGNGSGNFSFSSTKQLKDKCFSLDQTLFETWMDSIAKSSLSFDQAASDGQAGVLTTGTSTYLFDDKGIEHLQFIEKGLMGAVFMHQALNVYFGLGKMEVDNTTAVDPSTGKYYTAMEHHFDEAFGYFGVDIDFPTTTPNRFWGKYCDAQNGILNSNADMMNNFLKGRAAITNDVLADRDAAILNIRKEWEEISAYQAMKYLDDGLAYFGNDNAKFLHVLAEAYAFAWNLRYAPVETRRMSPTEHADLMALFPESFWSFTIADINAIKAVIEAKY